MNSGYEEVRQSNPREKANCFSWLTFGYTIPLFRKGNLQESDIYEVPKSCSSQRCGDKLDRHWPHCRAALLLLIKAFGLRYFLYTCIHLTWDLINSTGHAYAMSRFIAYFEKGQNRYTRHDAYYYGGIVMFLSVFRSLWIHNYFMFECILGIQMRSGLTSLIYRKVIRLRPEQVKGSSMGNIVTVLTKDIRTLDTTIWPLSDLFIGWVKFFYITYLIYARVGIPALIVAAAMLSVILLEGTLSRYVLKLRLKVGKMADKRLHLTREVLSALKVIKMYTWERFFQEKVCDARKKETRANLRCWYLGSLIIAIGILYGKLQFPIFLLSYMSWGYRVDTELVYYLMSLFREHTEVIGTILPMGFGLSAEFYASVVRVGRILNLEEAKKISLGTLMLEEAKIEFQKVSVVVDGNAILDDVSFSINKPGLYMLTGALGSGKSSVLKVEVILEEYTPSQGKCHISGNLSYASQDPWLFPATIKQNIIFGEPFDPERYDKIIKGCSLAQDLSELPSGDNTVIIDGGLNLSKGQQARVNLARAIYKQSDIYLLDDPLACLDVRVQDEIFRECFQRFLREKIVVLVTQDARHLKHARKLIVFEHGQIKSIMNPEEILSENDEMVVVNADNVIFNNEQLLEEKQVKIYHEEKNVGGVAASNYYSYVKYGGGVLIFALIIVLFFLSQFTESYSDKLLSNWVNQQQSALNSSSIQANQSPSIRNDTFDLYMIMIIVATIIDLIKSYGFLAYCRMASIKFHKLMCKSVINCSITFLDNHFIGNILNRFSYDLDHIDEVFPFLFKSFLMSIFAVGGALVLVVTVDWIFLLLSFVFLVTLFLLRTFYIPAARSLKRLTATTRSPFIGHLNATVDGLSTIKAFKAENLLKSEFDKHQDLAVSVIYMELATTRAFGFALDLNSSLFVVCVVLIFLFVSPETSVGNVGLVLTQIIMLSGNLQWIIRAWTLLEQCMTSVERVVEYTDIQQEDQGGEKPAMWPAHGNIQFQNVCLEYNFDSQIVLKNLNFSINSREKVGIVGRTGAGKSSIVSILFRLYKYQGNIIIDDQDISKISVDWLRRHISIIPQDPIIFAGTVRENIDPYGSALDKDIWKAIKNVTLQSAVANLDENILDLQLSTGQKQLVCVARALLKNNRIVVMDEPTANLDAESDRLVQELVKQNFGHCTLVMIAHRLQSTLECDKVMVMENGEVVEFDEPQKLLKNKKSLFYQMINIVQ